MCRLLKAHGCLSSNEQTQTHFDDSITMTLQTRLDGKYSVTTYTSICNSYEGIITLHNTTSMNLTGQLTSILSMSMS